MPSQTRNYILFFLSFILIYAGYFWVRNHLWPPPKPIPPEAAVSLDRTLRMITAVSGDGLADAARLAEEAILTRQDRGDWALAVKKEEAEKLAAKPPEPPPPPPEPATPADLITLGESEDYNLRVVMTNRGAGVHELTLTKFKAADWYGVPATDKDKKPLALELIPPIGAASFAMYHYPSADKEEARPLDTLGNRDWQVVEKKTDGDEQRVVFSTEMPEFGVRLVKTFTLKPREYHLGLTIRIERLANAKTVPFRYQLAGVGTPPPLTADEKADPNAFKLANKRAVPIEGGWYATVFRNALFDWVDGKENDERNLFDSRTIALKGGSDRTPRNNNRLQYAAVANQYFTSAIVIADDQPKRDFVEFVRATVEGEVNPHKQQLDDITVRAIAEPVEPKADAPIEHKYLLYHGPVKVKLLEQLGGEGGVSSELAKRYTDGLHLHTLTDYGSFSGNSYFSFWTTAIIFFTNVVHNVIWALRKVSPNDAVCIILVTVLVRLVMLPMSRKQAATMAKTQEGMAKIKPELAKLKERFKNDLVAQQQAQMELYRKNGINPAAGLGGCLMLLVQMPIFLGLYFALQESFFFRLESFLWIRNLTAPDMLCPWLWRLDWSQNIPYISSPDSMGSFFYLGPFLNLLPIVALALMFFQMKYMQPPPADEQMAQQQKMMQYIMIPMFAFMFYKMPSGLCLYFISTTLWGLAERKFLPKKKPAAELATGNGRPPRSGGGGGGGTVRGRKPPPGPPPGKLREWWEKLLKEASKK